MHLFRVTFSTDLDEYYKASPNDLVIALTVDAKNFEEAMVSARQTVAELVKWAEDFDIVSIAKLDATIESFVDQGNQATVINLK